MTEKTDPGSIKGSPNILRGIYEYNRGNKTHRNRSPIAGSGSVFPDADPENPHQHDADPQHCYQG